MGEKKEEKCIIEMKRNIKIKKAKSEWKFSLQKLVLDRNNKFCWGSEELKLSCIADQNIKGVGNLGNNFAVPQ